KDANMKLLRYLPSAWNNIALIMRKKSDLDILSMDDLYNNLKLDNENLEQIDTDDLEKINLKWQVAMLTMRVKTFIKKTGRKLDLNSKETVSFDRTKVECYNCHRRGHFAKESRAPRYQGNRNKDAPTRNALVDTSTANALNEAVYEEDIAFLKYDVQVKDIFIKETKNQLEKALKEKDDLKLKLEKFETSSKKLTKLINSQINAINKTGLGYDGQMNESDLNDIHVNESEVLNNVVDSCKSDGDDNQVNDRFKKGEGYHAVSHPYTGNYMPPRADLSFVGLDNYVFKSKESDSEDEIVFEPKEIEFVNATNTTVENENKAKNPRKFSQSPRDSEDEIVFEPKEVKKTVNPSLEKIEFVNATNTTVENENKAKNLGSSVRVLGGKTTGPKEIRPVWDSTARVNYRNKLTHPHPKRSFVPLAVLIKSGQVPVNVAKQSSHREATSVSAVRRVNTAASRPNVNNALPKAYSYFEAHSPDQGIFESGCSRHMTRNKFYLTDYQEIDDRFVVFGGNAKGGKINGKGNLARGLPSKSFENNHTCVASQKGKQHKASCKTKAVSSICKPLQLLHIDLFGCGIKTLPSDVEVTVAGYGFYCWRRLKKIF
nr:ribonuclease H-like domain-containing protein [Tanacetum cinerariifolium]